MGWVYGWMVMRCVVLHKGRKGGRKGNYGTMIEKGDRGDSFQMRGFA